MNRMLVANRAADYDFAIFSDIFILLVKPPMDGKDRCAGASEREQRKRDRESHHLILAHVDLEWL
jgi:hypothetical protein